MKKIILTITILLLVVGCSFNDKKDSEEDYLSNVTAIVFKETGYREEKTITDSKKIKEIIDYLYNCKELEDNINVNYIYHKYLVELKNDDKVIDSIKIYKDDIDYMKIENKNKNYYVDIDKLLNIVG